MSLFKDYNIILFFGRLGHLGVIFIAANLYYFSTALVETKRNDLFIKLYYFICLIFAILLFTSNYYINGLTKFQWGYYPRAAFLHTIALILFQCIFIFRILLISFFGIIEAKKNHNYNKMNKIKYTFAAICIYTFANVDFIAKYGLSVYPFGYIFALMFLLTIFYSIVKHKLMDINIVFRKGLIYSILATLITILYFSIVFLSENLFRGLVGYKSIPLTLAFVTVFIMLFQPLKNRIQSFVDRYFFKGTKEEISQENERLMEELRRSERLRAVGTLAAGMAHEIKNPLSAIKTFTEFLPEKYKDPTFRDKFKRIVGTEVEKINSIVGQLLDFAKPKSLSLKEIDIHILIDDTLSLLSNAFIKRKINVVKEYAPDIQHINADINQLKQVFLNLFLNAIDAMPNGGVLAINTCRDNTKMLISIKDTGCGIPKANISHLFDPFYTTKEGSTGMGLAVVYGIIKKHHGSITAESVEGKGSKFVIRL